MFFQNLGKTQYCENAKNANKGEGMPEKSLQRNANQPK